MSSGDESFLLPSPYEAESTTRASIVLKALETIAPMTLAEPWDNVGILMNPPIQRKNANKVLICIDVTESVVREVFEDKEIGVILAYHPALFSGLKRMTLQDERQYVASACASLGVSIVCPHTAVDNCVAGVNDWLAMAFTSLGVQSSKAIKAMTSPAALASTAMANEADIVTAMGMPDWTCRTVGSGRIVELNESREVSVQAAVDAIKEHLGLKAVRVALPPGMNMDSPVRTIGICAGSGSSVLKDVKADLLFTGEYSHHDILPVMYRRSVLVLCEHSNTERGYLPFLSRQLQRELEKAGGDASALRCVMSKRDRDPLMIV
ncbi:hypothetical protein HDU67_008292 [Dinochytrium kinnereticum]|nr:hypothetical protein HDU67_008292 [Dinochytrium kinnereticum]